MTTKFLERANGRNSAQDSPHLVMLAFRPGGQAYGSPGV